MRMISPRGKAVHYPMSSPRKRDVTEQESGEIQDKAEALEHQVEQRLHEAERHEHRHHILTTAVTLLHVAIAITTIAIITKGRRWPWHMGLALGAAGVGWRATLICDHRVSLASNATAQAGAQSLAAALASGVAGMNSSKS